MQVHPSPGPPALRRRRAPLKKCFFGLQEMDYLGYIVSASKISVSTNKVEAVADWLVPTTQKEIRSLVQFCNFYAKLIHHFSDLKAPLTDLLRKS
jgi:DNA-binding LytR/AlgR family response regulator